MSHPSMMSAEDTGLLVIDVQEKLMALIPQAGSVVCNIAFLIDVARLLRMPVQASEQYPRGLGPTVPELAQRLPTRPDKLAFSCCALPALVTEFQRQARPKLLLAGIEAHVCVQQSALDLLAAGFRVYVAADAVASRYPVDRDFALRRMEQAGVVLTTTEAAGFEWVRQAGTPEFKTLSKLVQERMQALKNLQDDRP
jgi:nicotinamidase-related amidase